MLAEAPVVLIEREPKAEGGLPDCGVGALCGCAVPGDALERRLLASGSDGLAKGRLEVGVGA